MEKRVFTMRNNCGITIIKVEQMRYDDFGRLTARIHNELSEDEQGLSLEELCNRIDDVSREMIELAMQELIEDGEIYDYMGTGVYRIL